MKRPWTIPVCMATTVLLLFAAPGAVAAAGHGGGGGGGGGHAGGFSGNSGGGYSFGRSYSGGSSWQGHSSSMSTSRGAGDFSRGHGGDPASWSGTRGTGVSGNRFSAADLIHSNPAHLEAMQGHHPWDASFAHHPGNPGWRDFYDHHHHHHFPFIYPYAFWLWPFWDPWWYSAYSLPYSYRYVYCYDDSPYAEVVPASVSTAGTSTASESEGYDQSLATSAEANSTAGDLDALRLYNAAREAFRSGEYRDALRLTNHAAIEAPQNPKVHELASLALFALGDYRGAAIEAHAAMAFGPVADWAALSGHYGDAEAYTKQLRALEKYVGEHKSAADAHFLAAYHYLMLDSRADAKDEMAQAAKLTPKDKLAAHVLQLLESGKPVTPPKPEPPKPAAKK